MGLVSKGDKGSTESTGTTVIARGTCVEGELKPEGNLLLEGNIVGAIISDHDVTIGPEGSFEGILKAARVRVAGLVNGQLECRKIEILPTGHVVGEIHTEALIITPGGRFRGQSREQPIVQQSAYSKRKNTHKPPLRDHVPTQPATA